MKKILIIMALAISLATVASGQVVKDLVGRVTAAVSVGGSNYHCAFTSSYGYAHTSIAAGDEYAVRNGNDVVRYQVNSTTTVGVLPGYNIILNMTPMDGYGGSFPTAVAEVYRPTTNWGLSLVDPNVPVILQWGLVNKNFLEIDSTMGLFVQYSDSLVTFVTPTQLADSLVEAKEIYFTTTVPTGHATYKMAVDTVGTDTIYFNKTWPSSASWVRFSVGSTYSASQGVIDSSSVFQLGNPTSVTNSIDRFLRDRYIALNGKKFNIGDATNTILQLDGTTSGNRIGMFTAAPSVAIGIGGDVNRTMRMERAIPANTNGNNLTIQAGGATSGGLNREGGSLILNAGESTGDGSGGGGGGSGGIYFGTSDPDAGVSGTSDNFVFTRMSIIANGNVGMGTGATSVSELLTLGEPFAKRGTLSMAGNAGGKVIIQPDTAAGTWTWTIPTTNGNPGEVLTTDGSGVTSWAAASGGSPIQFLDEGAPQGTSGQAVYYNFVGAGVSATVSNDTATITIAGGAGLSGVTDLTNGLDGVNNAGNVEYAFDILELTYAAVEGADSLFFWDSSTNTYKRGSVADLVALAPGAAITGVTDQANGLDIVLNGTNIEISYDFSEVADGISYSGLEQILYKDLFDNVYKKMSLSALSGGYVDFLTTQLGIGGEKGFTTELHWGAATLPAGVNFGTSEQTTIGIKGGTIQSLAESVWQDFAGLIIESTQPPGGGTNTTSFIATGDDSGTPDGSVVKFWTRPAGASQNVVENMRIQSNGLLFGNATTFSSGAGNGVINTPIGGIGFDGSASNYRLSGVSAGNGGLGLFENGNLNMEVPPGQQAWVPFSDIRMKHDTVALSVTAANIRDFKAYTYKWNASDSTTIGVIAQQVDALYPNIVRTMGGTVDTLGVDYNGLAAVAYAAAAALQLQIDSLSSGATTDSIGSAGDIDPPLTNSVIMVGGSTTINALTSTGRANGNEVTLIFTGTMTVKNNTAGGAGTSVMLLSGGADFSATPSDVLKLVYYSNRFYEVSRSVN